MNIMLIKANQALYASRGVLNEALFQMSCNILVNTIKSRSLTPPQAYGTSTTKSVDDLLTPAPHTR